MKCTIRLTDAQEDDKPVENTQMTTTPANHYVLVGSINGIIDTSGPGGQPVVNIQLDGTPLENAELRDGDDGIEVTALVEQVPDLRTVRLRLIIPRVNVAADATLFSGVALITTGLTTIGGPNFVEGPLHLYDVRPVAGTAEAVQTS
jgi:hypothetical protein